jgi:MerR family transcriptional regulator, thiopeptide resistance regulator
VQGIVERWQNHMDYFWTPKLNQLVALANGYNDDPRFKANFDEVHPVLTESSREAAKFYAANHKK